MTATRSPLAPKTLPELSPLEGVELAAVEAGIRYQARPDMLLMRFAEMTTIAGSYTRSLTAAAPVQWCRKACSDDHIRALLVNAGNANAFTGQQGERDTRALAQATADAVGCEAEQVMICATGVIGELLPMDPMNAAIPSLQHQLSGGGWQRAAEAIMTTDTFPKLATREATIGDTRVTLHGIAKGSGMIAPDMATMLGFIVTDAALPASVLQALLNRYTRHSFNAITVDGDTSTNDTLLFAATGARGNTLPNDAGDPMLHDFKRALFSLMRELAQLIVRDGEGATKFITLQISGAEDDEAARQIGLRIANSPLVKTACAAADPNWGRIIAAAGVCEQWIDSTKLALWIGDVPVTKAGGLHPQYSEEAAATHMQQSEITLSLDVGVGAGEATVWTSDLTEDYIRINAAYRS